MYIVGLTRNHSVAKLDSGLTDPVSVGLVLRSDAAPTKCCICVKMATFMKESRALRDTVTQFVVFMYLCSIVLGNIIIIDTCIFVISISFLPSTIRLWNHRLYYNLWWNPLPPHMVQSPALKAIYMYNTLNKIEVCSYIKS